MRGTALATLAILTMVAVARAQQCPANCLSCQRTRAKLKPGRAPLAVGDNADPQNAPLRTRCAACQAGYAPSKNGRSCDCAAGYAASGKAAGCLKCASGSVAQQGPPGSRQCVPCGAGQVPNSDGSGCIKSSLITCSKPCDPVTEVCRDGKCVPLKSCYLPVKCPPEQICGAYTACNQVVMCGPLNGACPTGERCSSDGFKCIKDEPRSCTPATACPTGRVCGYYDDGCQGQIPCGPPELGGNCPNNSTCNADGTQCVSAVPTSACSPKNACAAGKQCGEEDDGCGGKVKCGTNNGACPTNQNCTITGQCITPPQGYTCTATKTRCDPAMKCGTQTNNCGKHMVCGMCPPNYRCSVTYASGGVPLSSECVPAQPPLQPCPNKCDYGQVCGFQFNEVCGINIPCGPPCPNGFRCADDGASCVKTRVCPPRPTCLGNWTCSAQDDGCGGETKCSTSCGTGELCLSGTCVWQSEPCLIRPAEVCAGRVCGTFVDNCDGTTNITCGTCNPGSVCSFDGKTCFEPQKPCTPLASCTQQCGPQPDGCNGTLACGSCTPPAVCTNGVCVTPPVPRSCSQLGETCEQNTDCCGSSNSAYCIADSSGRKTCKTRPGGLCVNGGLCGKCVPNCGRSTSDVCSTYNVPGCTISARGGGGHLCGHGSVCCVIFKPYTIAPDADGQCSVPA